MDAEFDKAIDLNVRALFYAILPTAKIMKEQGGGCIINTSSMLSISGQPAGVGYPTSKFAVNGMMISLARNFISRWRLQGVIFTREKDLYVGKS